jgi:chromosome segregation ATPase
LSGMLIALSMVVYMILDPKMRNLVSFAYKSVMRWITGIFVNLDPIGVLKSYIEHLESSLSKMDKQINQLRGQMHKLKELIVTNQKEIQTHLKDASKAREAEKETQMILKTRKAGRLTESNVRLDDLYKRMESLYRILSKMRDASYIMSEDLKDQIFVKETERKAIMASHSAMNSAMSILKGDPDKRVMFDMALEAIANDVSSKVGEMEQFMSMSDKIMKGIDLQNGVFEEEGLAMLDEWEKKSQSLLLGTGTKDELVLKNHTEETLDLNAPIKQKERDAGYSNQYDAFFE